MLLRSLAVLSTLMLPACGDAGSGTGDTGGATSSGGPDGSSGGSSSSAGEGTSEAPGSSTGAAPTTGEVDPTAGSSTGADASTTAEASTGEASTGDTTTGAAEELPPIASAEELEAWLAGGAYKQWAAESQIHPSTGPHGGSVRTYVNAIALGSLAAQQAEHPQDSALVKELYGGGDTVIGYAVMRKTAPLSQGGANWYWYERIDATVYADGNDVALCSGCHGAGADYILTPYPLQ